MRAGRRAVRRAMCPTSEGRSRHSFEESEPSEIAHDACREHNDERPGAKHKQPSRQPQSPEAHASKEYQSRGPKERCDYESGRRSRHNERLTAAIRHGDFSPPAAAAGPVGVQRPKAEQYSRCKHPGAARHSRGFAYCVCERSFIRPCDDFSCRRIAYTGSAPALPSSVAGETTVPPRSTPSRAA